MTAVASGRKLEQDLTGMVDAFHALVRAARVTDERDEGVKQEVKGTGELVEVLAERLVVSGQSVLTLIAELKRLTLLTDLPALNAMVAAKNSEHNAARSASEQSVEALAAQRLETEASEPEKELLRLNNLAQEVPLAR